MTTPSGKIDVQGLIFRKPLPGHWSSDEGTEMANTYASKSREDLGYGQQTDLALANAIFMVSRHDLELMALQTAAKERIRWLSVQLAIVNLREKALLDRIEALEKALFASLGKMSEASGIVLAIAMSTNHPNPDEVMLDLYRSLQADINIARSTLSGAQP